MWLLDRSHDVHVLRVGRVAVEHWTGTAAGLHLESSASLPALGWHKADILSDAIQRVLTDKPRGKVVLVLESAWTPVLLAEVGTRVWSPPQLQTLLRHRLALLYADDDDAVSTWDVRVVYRPGDTHALGYGLPLSIRQALTGAGQAVGLKWARLMPAFDWGLQRLRPVRQWPRRSGWWLWPEQDRMLVAHFAKGQLVGLNAGAPLLGEPQAIERLVDIEAIRLGVDGPAGKVDVAAWGAPPLASSGSTHLNWRSLGRADESGPSTTTATGPSASGLSA